MVKLNKSYMVSFIIDTKSEKSAVTVIEAYEDGTIKAIKRVTGEKANQIYNMLFKA